MRILKQDKQNRGEKRTNLTTMAPRADSSPSPHDLKMGMTIRNWSNSGDQKQKHD
jgi:hypothetical protein